MVAEFIVEEGELRGLVLSLGDGDSWLLGRDPEACTLILEDPDVERTHLICRQTDEGYVVEDVSEAKNVLLNNEPLTAEALLQSDDLIQIGKIILRFVTDEKIIPTFEMDQDPELSAERNFIEESLEESEGNLDLRGDQESSEEEFPEIVEEEPEEIAVSDDEAAELPSLEDEDLPPEPVEEELEEIAASDDEAAELPILEDEDLPPEPVEEEPEEIAASDDEAAELPILEDEDLPPEPVEEEPEEIAASDDVAAEFPSLEDEDLPPEPAPIESEVSEAPEPISSEESEEELTAAFFDEPVEKNNSENEDVAQTPAFEEIPEFEIDLTTTVRFILKVIAGPNTGAEYAIDMGKNYLIGTDTATCDIVFHDLSVSREHARLFISAEGEVSIEDLESRNGVVVDQRRIKEKTILTSSAVITIGTTSFFLIDREAPQDTIVTPVFEPSYDEEELEEEGLVEDLEEEEEVFAKQPPEKQHMPGATVFSLIVVGLVVLLGFGIFTLYQTKDVTPPPKDYAIEIQVAVKDFPGVKYTYNNSSRKLFLVGHVTSGIEKSELLYNLQALNFLKGIEDNVVDDEAVWQEMNLLLAKHSNFKGVSMHSPAPGVFVLNGYLKTEKQAVDLSNYMNIHFNYLNRLENHVVVEEQVLEEVSNRLTQHEFGAVNPSFLNGDLTLTGYIGSTQTYAFDDLLREFERIPGIRVLQNYVVVVSPEQQVIDLSLRYPTRYKVTGFSKHGEVNINVVINGRILTRGDSIDGLTITSIQPHTIFLEKEGLKYKIEYNK